MHINLEKGRTGTENIQAGMEVEKTGHGQGRGLTKMKCRFLKNPCGNLQSCNKMKARSRRRCVNTREIKESWGSGFHLG